MTPTKGKYDHLQPDEDRPDSRLNETFRDLVQIGIANELAEANALKRLDIKSRPYNNKAFGDIIEDL